ncbi:energy-coupling factor ABC transporter ATP-binding protein [Ruminococcus sp. CLA-AA-H200]|uniref:ABC transporter ATP-binding protein n=1 Tax=Ruminococcus turbiniformis TaxID=2881258 RepID=A0ABS8FY04_9FIRM|nr:ABC transporter ATP-binding protein [Ruminococcus turbiniformis]MCC2254943.1 energy-coupling factor ABC transporter ATP-binding protein [Ruminococcus turbiniformis]
MNQGKKPAVELAGLSYTYEGSGIKALDGVNLKIEKGNKVAFMGDNGSGKSTLFLCLNGIHRPDSGEISIGGEKITYTRKGLLDVRKKVGIVFQEPDSQLFLASVYQEISFGIMNLGVEEQTARREVERVMEELDITPFRDRPAHALSGGQKKQVAIADILVMHPEVMILDEPAAALDVTHTEKVHRIVEDLTKRRITVLMATHDIDYAYRWADQIVLMKNGRILKEGTPEEVCSDEALLKAAGLVRPAVLRLYEKMAEKGFIELREKPPKSIEELEALIARG